jgi:predicted DCC family thiol-disulfide oxidoreductase YuxK
LAADCLFIWRNISVNTEITDNKATKPTGWIFFDAECRFCVAGRRRWGKVFERRGYVWLPLQTPGTAARLGVTEEQLMAEMWLLPAGAYPINGFGAWIELMRRVWWLWPLASLLNLPGIRAVGQLIYRWVARNRYCIAGRCRIPPAQHKNPRRHAAFLELP